MLYRGDYDKGRVTIIIEEDYYLRGTTVRNGGLLLQTGTITIERGLLKLRRTITIEQRRHWHPTPVLLPGKSHGRRSLVGCSPWGR